YRELATLEARESWSRAEAEAFQLERLNAVWRHAILHVPHYRRLAFEASLPPGFHSLAEYRATVPILPKQVVRDDPQAFHSEQPAGGHWTRTGGSTGTPMNAFWGSEAHLEMLRCKYRFQAAWGLDIF